MDGKSFIQLLWISVTEMLTYFTALFSKPALYSYSSPKYARALSSRRSSQLLSTPCLTSTSLFLTLWLSSL